MKKAFLIFTVILLSSMPLLALEKAGSRGAFMRNGLAGGRYAAMGGAAEACVNDVFAIYWNPAGLAEIRTARNTEEDDLDSRIENRQYQAISEDELLDFADDTNEGFFQAGISGSMMAFDRELAFGGIAFSAGNINMGLGAYGLQSTGIDKRDESGVKTGTTGYYAGTGYLSLAMSAGMSSFGVSLKGVCERIDDQDYYGPGLDVGFQAELLPLVRIGCTIQDIGTSYLPVSPKEEVDEDLDFSSPVIRTGIALTSRSSDFVLALSVLRKIEQDGFEYNIGLEYRLTGYATVLAGFENYNFTAGCSINFTGVQLVYAFAFDRTGQGYNNTVSALLML